MRIDVENARAALNDNYILVLTTNSIEKAAVNERLESKQRASVGVDTDGAYLGRLGGRFVLHLTGTSGAQREKSIGSIYTGLVSRARFPRPTLIVVCGVAWGNSDRVNVGDVLVSSEVWAVNHRRVSGGVTEYRLDQKRSPLLGAEEVLADLARLQHGWRVVVAPIASGETYFDDTAARNELIRQHPGIFGGEMESFSLVDHLRERPWLVIRGISDFGEDGTTRNEQLVAADRAAHTLFGLLECLEKSDAVPSARQDAAGQLLQATLDGDALSIGRDDHGETDISWHLNEEVAPGVIARLTGYTVVDVQPERIARDVADLLMEVTQNAIRHGGATSVTITFRETSVELSDDGRSFSIADLAGPRGGAEAWRRFRNDYLQSGLVSCTSDCADGANRYRFTFAKIDRELALAKASCQAEIINPFSRAELALEFGENCEAVYFDTGELRMTSVRQSVLEQLKQILRDGRSLYLSCWDERERVEYEEALIEFLGPKLHIFTGDATVVRARS